MFAVAPIAALAQAIVTTVVMGVVRFVLRRPLLCAAAFVTFLIGYQMGLAHAPRPAPPAPAAAVASQVTPPRR